MSAGVVKVRLTPRCGCCDRPTHVAVCSRCDEPMCDAHFVRLTDDAGEKQYVCTICAEIQLSERAARVDTLASCAS